MTNGREATERLTELNGSAYAGFSDWYLVSVALVADPGTVERELHSKFNNKKIPIGSEQELFIVSEEEIETELGSFKSISVAAHLKTVNQFELTIKSLTTRLAEVESQLNNEKEKNEMLSKENNRLRDANISRKDGRKLLRELQNYKERFGELDN
jgi:predicted nuclease with TOPRIM domain